MRLLAFRKRLNTSEKERRKCAYEKGSGNV